MLIAIIIATVAIVVTFILSAAACNLYGQSGNPLEMLDKLVTDVDFLKETGSGLQSYYDKFGITDETKPINWSDPASVDEYRSL